MTLQNGALAGNPVLNELESLCSYVGDQLIFKERRHQRQLMDMIHNLRVYYITKKTTLPQNFQCLQDYEISVCAVESFLFPTFSIQHPEVTETECIHHLITKVYISRYTRCLCSGAARFSLMAMSYPSNYRNYHRGFSFPHFYQRSVLW